MERERRIHYIDSFKFSFILPVSEKFRYEMKIKTTGLNEYKASLEYHHHDWMSKNCDLRGDEITIFVNQHKLAPGKVYCHIKIYDKHGCEVESFGIDPHITLVYDHLTSPSCPSDVDTQQSIDIVRLYDKFYKMKDKVSNIEDDVHHKTGIKDEDGRFIPVMWLTTEDELDEPVYTKEQIHERFVTKDEVSKFIKTRDVKKLIRDLVSLNYLKNNYYTKDESNNRYMQSANFYSKAEVDAMLEELRNEIKENNKDKTYLLID